MKLRPIILLPALFCTAAARADFAMLPTPPQAPAAASSAASPPRLGPGSFTGPGPDTCRASSSRFLFWSPGRKD